MKKARSISTTVRNPHRIRDFLKIVEKIEWSEWNEETQCKLQILLIQARLYGFWNTQFYNWLTEEQIKIIENLDEDIEYEQAEEIFLKKNYEAPAMRWRQSANPLKKLWLIFIDNENHLKITELWRLYLNPWIDLWNILFKSFIKLQYPNPENEDFSRKDGFNIKPFIWTLQLIKEVNKKREKLWNNHVWLSKFEFSLFVHTLINYTDIEKYADKIIELRKELKKLNKNEQEKFKNKYEREYAKKFFWINDDEKIKKQINNLHTYCDNTIRYFRMTRYIIVRWEWHYIDLEPKRMIEIEKLLEMFDWSVDFFETRDEYIEYLSNINEPTLPRENKTELKKIVENLINDINELKKEKDIQNDNFKYSNYQNLTVEELNEYIEKLRLHRTSILEKINYDAAQSINNLENYINKLENIYSLDDKALSLEKYTTCALEALNDSEWIRPNYPVWDDNEPTNTAPWWMPDIECFYKNYNSICEVTMLKDRSQRYNEWQPVMRHLREFELKNDKLPTYCLFIAPNLHQDTINTFRISVKYEYQWKKQKIIPITIKQFISILNVLHDFKTKNIKFKHEYIKKLFDDIMNIEWIETSTERINSIPKKLENRKSTILQ